MITYSSRTPRSILLMATTLEPAAALTSATSTYGITAEEILRGLAQAIDPARILTRPIERIAFASDASFYRLIPEAVVQPKTTEEVKSLFRFSHQHQIPLCFRAGGTSLSGQAITDGILVDVGRYWRLVRVEENGKSIRVQPGLIGQHANDALRLYSRKIGPDPASISSCRLGGILANNSSGMCCGVVQNAYHTIRSVKFVLPSGTEIDTADSNADVQLRQQEPDLYNTLLDLKSEIESNPALTARVRQKYKTKNTTGYSLNAFLDFDQPIEIFRNLLIGSEGTLAFIAEAVLNTVPDFPLKSTGLLLFPDLYAACSSIATLAEAGAAALELMDRPSLRSVENQPGVNPLLKTLPEDAAGVLVEFQAANEDQRRKYEAIAAQTAARLPLLHPAEFTSNPYEQAKLWKIRKGMIPSIGAVRASGTTAIIEDVTLPVDRLADASVDLSKLFRKHGYDNAILFGHAKDGNLHFVITQGFNSTREIERYRLFMDDVVALVVNKYDGALKAEHGTGRNMAPFVETEWGPDAYRIMLRLKAVTDPHSLLNPGVIVNSDPLAHISHLKDLPVVEEEVDKCIECGFCEHNCPSRDITLTPRQRIVVRREMQRLRDTNRPQQQYDALDKDFPYMVLDTCATDGLCAVDCPVSIDTGKLTKRFRTLRHSASAQKIAKIVARNFRLAETGARIALTTGHAIEAVFGKKAMPALTRIFDGIGRGLCQEPFWQWVQPMPKARKGPVPSQSFPDAQAVYFPACISRIFGALPGESDASTMQAMLTLADRAGVKINVPRGTIGHCCGVPFSSKGFDDGHAEAVNHTIASFYEWSDSGRLPIVIDTSPCTYGLRTSRSSLTPENQQKFDKLRILDSIEFVESTILPKLAIHHKLDSVALHPVCSATKMGFAPKLVSIAKACANSVDVPHGAGCCAFAGDRGFLHPELTASATEIEAGEIKACHHDGYFSSSRTCEVGMSRATGQTYSSYLHLLEQASRP
jgi:D-lactate dehydrogenase